MGDFKIDKRKLRVRCVSLEIVCALLQISSSIYAIWLSGSGNLHVWWFAGYMLTTTLLTVVGCLIPYWVFRFELSRHKEQLKDADTLFREEKHKLQVSVEYLKALLETKEGTGC